MEHWRTLSPMNGQKSSEMITLGKVIEERQRIARQRMEDLQRAKDSKED